MPDDQPNKPVDDEKTTLLPRYKPQTTQSPPPKDDPQPTELGRGEETMIGFAPTFKEQLDAAQKMDDEGGSKRTQDHE